MTLNYTTPVVNPRLGSSFAIFVSTYLSMIVLLVILEQLGLSSVMIDGLMLAMPACFYIAIGFLTRTKHLEDFYLSGQRVPPLYNALALCASVFGGSLFLGSIGSFFFLGMDAIVFPVGCFVGLILMAILFVPYLRKAGAYTLPGFFHVRFGQTYLRLIACCLMILPCFMLLVAEIITGAKIVDLFVSSADLKGYQLTGSFSIVTIFSIVFLSVVLGGMRSATWVQCAQFVVLLGVLIPLTIISVTRTNLPLPQLTYGSQIEQIKGFEISKGYVVASQPRDVDTIIPGTALQPLTRPVERVFSALQPSGYVVLLLCLATGIAVFPSFLIRLSITPSILATRRMFSWVMVIAVFIAITIPAYALFTKAMIVEGLIGVPSADIPSWSKVLQQMKLISLPVNSFDSSSTSTRITFQRDTLAFILPIAGKLPRVFLGIATASIMAAIFACASAQLIAIANMISNDFFHGVISKTASSTRRFLIGRLGMVLCGIGVFFVANIQAIDPFRWVIEAFSFASGTFFAVLVLSIWWRGLSALGAAIGLIVGFVITFFAMNTTGWPFGITSLTAGVAAIPVSFAVAIAVSVILSRPDRYTMETIDELRVPVGETLQSRISRLTSRGKSLKTV